MDFIDQPNNCLFCLNQIRPYIIADNISDNSDVEDGISRAFVIPTFEVVCSYLKLKFPLQFFRRKDNNDGESEGQQSIFRASSDKFLCLSCFEKINGLRLLHKEFRELERKINGVTKSIKRIIVENNEIVGGSGDGEGTSTSEGAGEEGGGTRPHTRSFARAFENHVRLVTESSQTWIGETKIFDAFMEIKQEVQDEVDLEEEQEHEEQEHEFIRPPPPPPIEVAKKSVISSSEPESESECESDASDVDRQDREERQNKELTHAAAKTLQELAGEICSREKNNGHLLIERKQAFECHHCSKCYASIRNLEIHITSKHAPKKTKSKRTPLFPRDTFSLRAKTEIEIDGKKYFQCPHCRKNYNQVKALRNHIARHHPPGSKTECPVVTCTVCPTYRTFKNEHYLQRHIFNAHTHGSKFKCDQCDKKFHAKQSLKFHIEAEHKGVRYKCPDCPKYFTHPNQLKQHVRVVHHKAGLIKCPDCNREFARQCDLNSHAIIHDPTAPKEHVCEVCGKEFLLRAGLADHIKVHKERKFECTHCPDKFKKHSHLTAHLRKHTGEKPFRCGICEKAFAVKSTLTMHLKTHVGPPKKRGKKPKQKKDTEEEAVVSVVVSEEETNNTFVTANTEDSQQAPSTTGEEENLEAEKRSLEVEPEPRQAALVLAASIM